MCDEKQNDSLKGNDTIKDLAEKHLQIINFWISNADTKASFLLATIGILSGFLATYFKDFTISLCVIPFIFAAFCLILGAWMCLETLRPITLLKKDRKDHLKTKEEVLSKTRGKSLLFFEDIAEQPSLSDFLDEYRRLSDPGTAALHLVEQIYINSWIVQRKFKLVRFAVIFLFCAVLALALALVVKIIHSLSGL